MPKDPKNIKFSILILSIPSRMSKFCILQDKILKQIGDRQDVEMICLIDNKSLHIYEKRNDLIRVARGSHLTWLDDDDDISDDYIEKITKTISENPDVDVISFNQHIILNGQHGKVNCKMHNPHNNVISNGLGGFLPTLRPPYHWCVWKTSIATSELFNENYANSGQSCEDIDWLMRLYPKVVTEVHLDDELHIYRWSASETESIVKQ